MVNEICRWNSEGIYENMFQQIRSETPPGILEEIAQSILKKILIEVLQEIPKVSTDKLSKVASL